MDPSEIETTKMIALQTKIDDNPDIIESAGERVSDRMFAIINQVYNQLIPEGEGKMTDMEYNLIKKLILEELCHLCEGPGVSYTILHK